MISQIIKVGLLLGTALWLNGAQAGLAQSELPIEIQSDSARFDSLKGVALYRGRVVLSQGDHTLTADELLVTRSTTGTVQDIIATGSPAHYKGQLEAEKPALSAQASKITYTPHTTQLLLEGHAELQQQHDVFKGPQIQYDIKNRLVTSQANAEGRSVIVLQPR